MNANKCLGIIWSALIVAAIGFVAVEWNPGARAQQVRQPFSNAVSQRAEMIRELKEIKGLLKEQNALLRQIVANGQGKRTP